MRIHWPGEEEGRIMRGVELITKNVNGGNQLDVVLCA